MRQVFSSRRLENVEGVAQLLREADIEVHISNPRSYKGNRRGDFSYRASASSAPESAVWIVRSEDQPRARALLREAGLLASSRGQGDSYLSPPSGDPTATPRSPQQRAIRIKLVLLAGIGVVLVLVLVRMF